MTGEDKDAGLETPEAGDSTPRGPIDEAAEPEQTSAVDKAPGQAEAGGAEAKGKKPFLDRVVIWAWPKTIVFWPTCLCALIFGFVALATNPYRHAEAIRQEAAGQLAAKVADAAQSRASLQKIYEHAAEMTPEKGKWLGIVFLLIFAYNLIAFSFDIRVKGLAIAILVVCAAILALLYISTKYDVLLFVRDLLRNLNPYANAAFYFTIGIFTLLVLSMGMLSTYLHRWDVSHNEVIIRTGMLETEKRLSTQHLTFSKRITDLMEHWFLFFGMFSKKLGCGQLVFNHPQMEHPIVLDNVIGLEAKAEQLGRILGVVAVKDDD